MTTRKITVTNENIVLAGFDCTIQGMRILAGDPSAQLKVGGQLRPHPNGVSAKRSDVLALVTKGTIVSSAELVVLDVPGTALVVPPAVVAPAASAPSPVADPALSARVSALEKETGRLEQIAATGAADISELRLELRGVVERLAKTLTVAPAASDAPATGITPE